MERNHKLDYLFSTRDIVMKEKPKVKKDDKSDDDDDEMLDEAGYKNIPTVGVSYKPIYESSQRLMLFLKVFCDDCDELVQLVLYERGLDPHTCDVHVGFDGGQGILKIRFTVTERTVEVTSGERSKYSEVCYLKISQS